MGCPVYIWRQWDTYMFMIVNYFNVFTAEFNINFWWCKFSSLEVWYFEIGWEILTERRRQRKLATFYKMHNKSCPQYLSHYLPPVASYVSGYNLINNENYVLPKCRLRISEQNRYPFGYHIIDILKGNEWHLQ
jgi:hypothetical protein